MVDGKKKMSYAVAFDLDTEILRKVYPNDSYANAYSDIKNFLMSKGFDWQQGSVYFGVNLNAVECILAVQNLSKTYPWFKQSVRDIRLLRIEEMNDLFPVL